MRHIKVKAALLMIIGLLALHNSAISRDRENSDDNQKTSFKWEGLSWVIPKDFFLGFRPYTQEDKEMWVQFGYVKSDVRFISANEKGYDLRIDAHIRRLNIEDPRNALAMIHRVGTPFERLPIFTAATFNGMTYVGSDALGPYFRMSDEDAYVECHQVIHDKVLFPKTEPDALNKEYVCGTTFSIPSGLYVWVTVSGVHLNDVAKAFVTTQKMVRSFIH